MTLFSRIMLILLNWKRFSPKLNSQTGWPGFCPNQVRKLQFWVTDFELICWVRANRKVQLVFWVHKLGFQIINFEARFVSPVSIGQGKHRWGSRDPTVMSLGIAWCAWWLVVAEKCSNICGQPRRQIRAYNSSLCNFSWTCICTHSFQVMKYSW